MQACGWLLARHTTRRAGNDAAAVRWPASANASPTTCCARRHWPQLAAEAGIGKFQLLRRFAAQYGCTPHAFLLQQRAERVRALIRQGSSLADAAAAAGFADQAHMTRIFTRQFGFTPGAWQRAARVQ